MQRSPESAAAGDLLAPYIRSHDEALPVIKRIEKVGNSSSLVLDKAILELIGLKEDGEVQLTIRDGSLIVTPVHPELVDDDRFERALDRVMESRRDALRRLAE
ncbi:MAG: AbrB/MazE/SpoVT family DNA-binding domain-containing protein [Planctomycetota bacterium]